MSFPCKPIAPTHARSGFATPASARHTAGAWRLGVRQGLAQAGFARCGLERGHVGLMDQEVGADRLTPRRPHRC